MHSERYTVLFSFKKFIDTIPLSSVECEKLFSVMNYTKDKSKSVMTTRNLFYRIMLKMHSGPVNLFDYESAFEIWKQKKNRYLI